MQSLGQGGALSREDCPLAGAGGMVREEEQEAALEVTFCGGGVLGTYAVSAAERHKAQAEALA